MTKYSLFRNLQTLELHIISNSSPEIDEYISMKDYFKYLYEGYYSEIKNYINGQ